MAWEEMVPTRLMVALLEKKFFPKWREALKAWLQQDPDFGEVERWYTGWKAQFSENLQAHERIRGQFNRALKMMNSVVSGEPIEDEPWQPPRASSAEQATASEEHPATFRSRQEAAASAASLHRPAAGMRDLLEAFAQEQSIEFLPKSGRQHEGLQVSNTSSTKVRTTNTVPSCLSVRSRTRRCTPSAASALSWILKSSYLRLTPMANGSPLL